MKLNHQTGIATLIQLIALSLFALISQAYSAITTCSQDGSNCISNLITSIIFYVLVAAVFGGIWLVGLFAQNSRNKWLARLLIGIEFMIAGVALFSIKIGLHGHVNIPGLLASMIIAAIAVWTMILAYRLMKYEGRRIASSGRRRRRRARRLPEEQ